MKVLLILGDVIRLKRTPPWLLIAAIPCISGCASTFEQKANHYLQTVSFPNITLAEGERINSVEVVVSCARFGSINHIPEDWSVQVVSPESEISTLKAQAGHGNSALWTSHNLEDFITIMDCDASCFTIKASMTIFIGEKERTVTFVQSDLMIRREP